MKLSRTQLKNLIKEEVISSLGGGRGSQTAIGEIEQLEYSLQSQFNRIMKEISITKEAIKYALDKISEDVLGGGFVGIVSRNKYDSDLSYVLTLTPEDIANGIFRNKKALDMIKYDNEDASDDELKSIIMKDIPYACDYLECKYDYKGIKCELTTNYDRSIILVVKGIENLFDLPEKMAEVTGLE